MLTASTEATEALKALMTEKELGSTVRIFAQHSCGGSMLALGVDEAKDSDSQTELDGLTFLVDQDLATQVGKINVDYVNDADQPGFAIGSEHPLPAPQGSCGDGCSCC